MIVPMKKVSVVTLRSMQDQTLDALRDLGVLHVFTDRVESDRSEKLREHAAAIDRALTTVPAADGESADQSDIHGPQSVDAALELAESAAVLSDERSSLEDEQERITRELERLAPWGDFDPQRIAALQASGVKIGLYEVGRDNADDLIEAVPQALVLERGKSLVRLVGIASGDDRLPASPDPISLPEQGPADLRARLEEIDTRSQHIDAELGELSPRRPVLLAAQEELEQAFEFVRVQSTMDAEKELTWITGFLPEDLVDTVRQAARHHGWGVVVRDPEPDEQVPTQTRNPKPVRIIKPVFDLLGTVPGYREVDISLFFLMFFVVFFAMIIGDGGYGVILLAGTLFAMFKGLSKGKKPGVGSVLMLVLSSATVVWGAVTGNWFGYRPFNDLPVLRDLVIPALSVDNESSTLTIQYMTFVIGTVHLSIAHLWNFLRGLSRKPTIAAFEQLGWLSMVLGLYYLVLDMVLGTVAISIVPRPDWWLTMVIGGLAAVIVFGSQEEGQNFFVGVAKGAANIITTALDGVSAFSDIISYIRLFAVGLASLAIAEAFNQMAAGIAGSLDGVIGAVVAALILFLGHTLNLATGAVSVVVHGGRLNMLEFSQNL